MTFIADDFFLHPSDKLTDLEQELQAAMRRQNQVCSSKAPGYDDEITHLKKEIAWLLVERKQYERALVYYQSMSGDEGGEEKYVGMGRALSDLRRFEEADAVMDATLRSYPQSAPMWLAAGNNYQNQENYVKALECFKEAQRIDPDHEAYAYSCGNALYGLRLYEDAFATYQQLSAENPIEERYPTAMGYCRLQTGYPEDASVHFQKAMTLCPLSCNVYNGMFWAYIDRGLANDAVAIAREGLRQYPDEDDVLYVDLAYAYLEMNRMDDAKAVIQQGLKLFPDSQDLNQLLNDINNTENDPNKGTRPAKPIILIILADRLHRGKKV